MQDGSLLEGDATVRDTGPASPRGALLGAGAVVVWNDVTDEGREEFYRWHDREHIPERLAIPGFRRGRRFICRGHRPEWLTVYEADDLAVVTSEDYLARLNAPTPWTVSTLKHFRNTSRAVCRVVESTGSSTGGHVLAMRLSARPGTADVLCRTIRNEAFPRAMALTGMLACHLLAADEAASYAATAESRTREFDVPSWVVLCEASTPEAAGQARAIIDGPALRALGVAVRDDAAVYTLEICRLSSSAERR